MPKNANLVSYYSRRWGLGNPTNTIKIVALLGALVACIVASILLGAIPLSFDDLFDWVRTAVTTEASSIQTQVITNLRIPRTILALAVGSGLAMAGALFQGVFRNPLADPSLLGVSAGAALLAGVAIYAQSRFGISGLIFGYGLIPIFAFGGAISSIFLLIYLGTQQGRLDTTTLLLAGIAVNALAFAGTGALVFVATDGELRSLTFWTMGSCAGATWLISLSTLGVVLFGLVTSWWSRQSLDALLLGEREAACVGVAVESLKRRTLLISALLVATCVSAAGVISFVGLISPHLCRILFGPSYRNLLMLSAVMGATLVLISDTLARTIVAPAELPIGILLSLFGAPFFLWLLRQRRFS